VVDVLNRASMMVYAPRLEPFGLAPLEAGACGVPVIAVAEGGVRETIVDGVTGLLVRNDPREAAAALTRLRKDRALARSLGSSARITINQKWSFEAGIDRIEEELKKCFSFAERAVLKDSSIEGKSPTHLAATHLSN
jgi:glycosyltransferase involved in cell wall biosynthesis